MTADISMISLRTVTRKDIPDNFGAASRHLNVNDSPWIRVWCKVDLRKLRLQHQHSAEQILSATEKSFVCTVDAKNCREKYDDSKVTLLGSVLIRQTLRQKFLKLKYAYFLMPIKMYSLCNAQNS